MMHNDEKNRREKRKIYLHLYAPKYIPRVALKGHYKKSVSHKFSALLF